MISTLVKWRKKQLI